MLYFFRGDNMDNKKNTNLQKMAYDKDYYKKYITRKVLNFNELVQEDAEILIWLKAQGERNMSQYIKRLVREDMEKHKK